MKQRDLACFTHAELAAHTHAELAEARLYVTDRTEKDVQDGTKKGSLCADDLNRIENNSAYLRNKLALYGFYAVFQEKWDWDMTDWPILKELNRIRDAVGLLCSCYYVWPQTPELPEDLSHPYYAQFNVIEQVQKDLDGIIDKMVEGYRYCNDCYCGEEWI